MDTALTDRHRDGDVDAASAARLEALGLTLRTVPHERPAFDGWLQATARGFLDPERTEEQIAGSFDRSGYRRLIGVYDTAAPQQDIPVGTFATWVSELSLPGDTVLPALAVSAVTVSPTHAGRGIARAMMEGELRHAAGLGIPLAALTASESTLYGRYGFAPAAAAATWTIEAKRAGWVGPDAPGRVDFITRDQARTLAPGLHERIHRSRPGELAMPDAHWGRFTGTDPDAKKPAAVRAVQYADASGDVQGVALYTVTENHDDYTKSSIRVEYLLAAGDEAYAGLWRFLLRLPLIGTITATELSTDEPLLWMIADQRAARITVNDHHYVRVLDVPAVLGARRYGAEGRLVVGVTDPLGLSEGRWLLEVGPDGTAHVSAAAAGGHGDAPVLTLGTTELSAICLGGVSPATLAAAGRVDATDAGAATRMFAWHVPPRLSFWY